jgi:hypothetical protein
MPPLLDDERIAGDAFLLRALLPKWSIVKAGRERPTSDSLLDSNFENSCFVEGELSVAQVQLMFPGLKLARLPVSVVRREGFALERRPEEAPPGCPAPEAHLVIGPLRELERGDYEGRARRIVKDPSVQVIAPPQP